MRRFSFALLPLLGVSLLLAACKSGGETGAAGALASAQAEEGAYFTDITEQAGIDFVQTLGDADLSNIVETVGSGVAWIDYDQDGYMDLYIADAAFTEGVSSGERPTGRHGDRLYRNLEGKGFEEVTRKAGIRGDDDYSMGVAVSDYDNDGYPDLYVSNYGPNKLYHNTGKGGFEEIAAAAGVAGNEFSVQSTWLDYNNDGRLDLFVGNYLDYDPNYNYYYQPDGFPPPIAYNGQPDFLFRNNGDGTFTDVTREVGLFSAEGRMMGVGAADYDGDGWTDLYVANDGMADYLYHNEGGKSFTEVGYPSGTAFSEGGEETSSMAVDWADYDGDGVLDLWVSDIHFSALYRNQGAGLFEDVTVNTGIAVPSGQYDGWGSAFVDYDNDGDQDIFKVNGAVNHLFGHESQVFANVGDGRFEDVSLDLGSFFHKEYVGRGAAFGDYDNDGDVDVVLNNLNSKLVFLRNEGLSGNQWLALRLVGKRSNRDGVGARVTLEAGGRRQVVEKKSVIGYISTNDPRLFFGLGKAPVADRIEIRWPSGAVQTLTNVKAGQILTVTEAADAEVADAAR